MAGENHGMSSQVNIQILEKMSRLKPKKLSRLTKCERETDRETREKSWNTQRQTG